MLGTANDAAGDLRWQTPVLMLSALRASLARQRSAEVVDDADGAGGRSLV